MVYEHGAEKMANLRIRFSEVNELVNLHIKCPCDLAKQIDSGVSRSSFNFPEVGAADARHEGELSLRDASLGSR